MIRRALMCAALGSLSLGRTAVAQPLLEPEAKPAPTVPAYQPTVVDQQDLPVRKKSYAVPALEIVTMNITANLAARAIGMPWAEIDGDTIKSNLSNPWTFDHDPYTINNAGHPVGGALLFSAARSTGHNWWVSGLYAFAGSAFWETFMENEVPSYNDQITTPIGGMFIGEMMHRASRALLYPGYGKPGFIRKAAASLIDPVGALNREYWGDAWAKTIPPSMYAHFGVGYQHTGGTDSNRTAESQFHAELFVEHGLTGDRAFQPKHPLDHFELRGTLDAGPDDLDGSFYVRGMLLGKGKWSENVRGMGGLFGAYDFANNEFVRASMLGVGPGGTLEVPIGRYGFIETTAAAYLVPWGAAGGSTEGEKGARDYHRGPGLAQVLELKAGRRGTGSVRLTTRAYEIAARFAGDDINEVVIDTTLGGMLHLTRHHAVGVEGTYAVRRTSTENDFTDQMSAGRAAQIRAFYAITMDEVAGR